MQDDRLDRTRLGRKENRVIICAFWINNVGFVFIIQLENARSNRHTRGCTDTQVAVNGDFRDFERLWGWSVAHMDRG